MKSMTGFGSANADIGGRVLSVEISSVNKKGLEISVMLPREWAALERDVAAKVRANFSRGKVGVFFKFEGKGGAAAVDADPKTFAAAFSAMKKLAEENGIAFEPDANFALSLAHAVAENSVASEPLEDVWKKLSAALDIAMEKQNSMRETEGFSLESDFKARLAKLSECVDSAAKIAGNNPAEYRDQLLEKLKNLGVENIDVSDERVLKEVCIFADKCDVTEELTRLKSHIKQFSSTMDEGSAVGRKLDFICQEIGREINTTASKANNIELTRLAISMKNINEQIREQVQNIE